MGLRQHQNRELTRPVFLAGHSAGAHIAALLAVDASYFQSQSLGPQNLCGVIGLAGHTHSIHCAILVPARSLKD